MPKLRSRVLDATAKVAADTAALPAEIDHPVEELHLIIARIAKALEENLTARGDPTQTFMELQLGFERDLAASVPEFIPILKEDFTTDVELDTPLAPGWPEHSEGCKQVFLGELYGYFSK